MAIASEIDVGAIPGTVLLVDIQGTVRAKHAKGGISDVLLVPAPSNDPDDPLNWSPKRKLLSTICVSVYTSMIGISSAALYSVLLPVATATGLEIGGIVSGTGYMFLMFGWGCLFWQPLALQYGKRPVYLFSLLASMAVLIWTPYTTSQGQWYANKILQGFFGAPVEALCEISVADVYFQHQRGTYLAYYAFALGGSSSFGGIIAGFINDGQGWEWVFYWSGIFCAMGFVFLFFFMEETNYDRASVSPITYGIPSLTDSNTLPSGGITNDLEKSVESPAAVVEPSEDIDLSAMSESTKSYWAKLTLLDKPRPNRLVEMFLQPLKFFSFPVVVWAGFSYGTSLVWSNVINGTASAILSSPPYNFPASMVGLTYLASITGTAIGAAYSGYFGDKVVLYLGRRNNGIVESEHRLWMFLLSLILVPGSLILWGVGAAHEIHWFGLIAANCFLNVANTIGISLSVAYCIDSYKAMSGNAMVTVILVRNTMSFAVSYGITPWMTNLGYQNAFIVAAFAGLAQCLSFLIMVKYGPWLRNASKARYWAWVQEAQELGIGH